jgi:hemerythrin superfamily protein
MEETERDVISVLTRDHGQVQQLFARLQPARDPAQRRLLAEQVTIELVRHAVAEEMYLFPVARTVLPDGDAIADTQIADHTEIEKSLKELEKTDPASPAFDVVLTQLLPQVQRHINTEEEELFPRLADHLGHNELIDLGDRVQAAKDKAPTRPHPAAPDRPPLNKLLAPGTGLVDRIRDRLSGRGRH